MARLLVLRPQPGADATVEKARELGLEAIAIPLFEIVPVDWQVPDVGKFDALLVTSANAIRHGGEGLEELRGLPVFAVGKTTADAAREAGFEIATTGCAGIDGLLAEIPPALRLLHLCGADRREPNEPRQEIAPIIVYRARPIAADLSTAKDDLALIHSPRAGRRFAELVSDREMVTIVAISEAAAESAGNGWRSVMIAPQPTDDALLALAASLCDKPDPK